MKTKPLGNDPDRIIRVTAVVALIGLLAPAVALAEDSEALKKRVAELEAQVAELRKPQEVDAIREENKQAARVRAREDRDEYSREELQEIETLYQVANKNWRSEEAVESLEKLIKKYDKANRTGCAVLYLGQMSKGDQRLEYLERAVKDFSDCYYFNGCQVGGYARLQLAGTLMGLDRKDDAKKLLDEIRKDYPNAVDHRGRLLVDAIKQIEK